MLPYKEEDFVRDSVDFVPGANWRARFSRVLEKSARVVTASSQRLEIGGISYDFCNQLLFGLAAIRARQLGAQLVPLTVWDGKAGDGPGGAASVVESGARAVTNRRLSISGNFPPVGRRAAEP